MKDVLRAALVAAVAMLAYRVMTATASHGLGLEFGQAEQFEVGTTVIYMVGAFVAGLRSSLWAGMAAALGAGLADGVVGWRITAAIYHPMHTWLFHDGSAFTFALETLMVAAILGVPGAGAGTVVRHILLEFRSPARP